jgi:hypothetical protein
LTFDPQEAARAPVGDVIVGDIYATLQALAGYFQVSPRAKYPIRARTFKSRVYEYYDPEVNSISRPVQMEVRNR